MNVIPEKRMELSQTISSLSISTRMQKGCRQCNFWQSVEDENRLFLLEEWDTRENLKNHLQSEHFKVIRGAMNLLQEPCETMFHNVLHPMEIEKI
jgi:quinol monooxygenase YgiN